MVALTMIHSPAGYKFGHHMVAHNSIHPPPTALAGHLPNANRVTPTNQRHGMEPRRRLWYNLERPATSRHCSAPPPASTGPTQLQPQEVFMSRTVFCQRLKKEAPGMPFQLIPGELGKRIFDHISQEAWSEWQKKQTMLINEKKLNMMNSDHRAQLQAEMVKYLFEDGDVQIEGYVRSEEHTSELQSPDH